MIAPEAVVTFARLEGFSVARSFGVVRGEALTSRNILAATFRSIGALIGLASIDYLSDAERARATALDHLCKSAERLGANGIVGLSFSASEHLDGSTRLIASGEAVLLDPVPG